MSQNDHSTGGTERELLGYGIPHLTSVYSTRHDVIGMAAVAGRKAPDHWGDVLDMTQRVQPIYERPNQSVDTETEQSGEQ